MTKKELFLATENAEILSFFINRGLARMPDFAGTGLKGFNGYLHAIRGCP